MQINQVELWVLIFFFVLVSGMGFLAARWKRAESLSSLDEWGLGGRNFGPWVTWFLLGGDLYTAYTFIAVPALIYGVGATGFFAVPYTIIVYPMVFLVAPRLWSVSHRNGYVTPADFVRGRSGSGGLALAIAITGIVATMPYIALQLVGIEAVIGAIGNNGNWPLYIAFAVLAVYTYSSGLRAPALIAFVKDTLIYIVVIVAIIYIPHKLGGWGNIFAKSDAKFAATQTTADGITLASALTLGYSTLALGSAMALFLYPHSVTAVLASRSRDTIKRNMAALPAYSFVLGLIALLGFMAIAAGIKPGNLGDKPNPNTVVPLLFDQQFPSWFAGVAFAAIAIGALVPAAIMSIAAANLFTRNIYKEYLRPQASTREEAQVSKIASLFVKVGALAAILGLDVQYALDLQLIGGVLILQVLPAVVFLLYSRWFHRWALLIGWAVGMAAGAWMLYVTPNASTGKKHFGATQWAFSHLGFDTKTTIYPGIVALVLNVAVAVLLSILFRAMSLPKGIDTTQEADYHLEAGDPGVAKELPDPLAGSGSTARVST
ncbi:MAG: solute:Na+ symporter, family [Frankiaceae bacterium]|nr:solute:Na+ symporter, family [Frankiaceae bacterium]